MSQALIQLAVITALSAILSTVSWAQPQRLQIDSEHSTARLTLISANGTNSLDAGIARVSGIVKLDSGTPGEDFLDLTIYPAHQGSRLLNPDGSLRNHGSADLSRYTVISFHSDHAASSRDGRLEIIGQLTINYFKRQPIIDWNNAYSGPSYDGLVQQSATHTATFILDWQSISVAGPFPDHISAETTIARQDFPNLRTSLLDSVWPLVVEDEHCEMPPTRADMRDYSGAICTGTPVLPTPPAQPTEYYFAGDYPGATQTSPPSDRANINLHLRLRQ